MTRMCWALSGFMLIISIGRCQSLSETAVPTTGTISFTAFHFSLPSELTGANQTTASSQVQCQIEWQSNVINGPNRRSDLLHFDPTYSTELNTAEARMIYARRISAALNKYAWQHTLKLPDLVEPRPMYLSRKVWNATKFTSVNLDNEDKLTAGYCVLPSRLDIAQPSGPFLPVSQAMMASDIASIQRPDAVWIRNGGSAQVTFTRENGISVDVFFENGNLSKISTKEIFPQNNQFGEFEYSDFTSIAGKSLPRVAVSRFYKKLEGRDAVPFAENIIIINSYEQQTDNAMFSQAIPNTALSIRDLDLENR